MKYLIVLLLSLGSTATLAQHRHHYHHHHRSHNWVAPVIIGGVVGYALAQRPPAVIYTQPYSAYQNQEIVYIDGIAYRRDRIMVNGYWQEVLIRL